MNNQVLGPDVFHVMKKGEIVTDLVEIELVFLQSLEVVELAKRISPNLRGRSMK